MNKIFIEAQKPETSEYNFLNTILSKYFPDKEVDIICIGGVDKIFNEANVNQMRQAIDSGDNVIVILDADNPSKNSAGFANRTQDIQKNQKKLNLTFPLFLYPNNAEDGDVETLMEKIAQKDLHKKWWDCFEDYEKCVQGITDENGNFKYKTPNLKGKLHTFLSAQASLNSDQSKKLGRGYWMFDNKNFWDIDKDDLKPLVDFLKENLK